MHYFDCWVVLHATGRPNPPVCLVLESLDSTAGTALASEMFPYMAPMQTGRISQPISHRTDVHSQGVTSCGKFPFPTELYSREAESATPFASFERVIDDGSAEAALVYGHSSMMSSTTEATELRGMPHVDFYPLVARSVRK